MFLNTFHREHILLKLTIRKLLRKIRSKNLTAGVFFNNPKMYKLHSLHSGIGLSSAIQMMYAQNQTQSAVYVYNRISNIGFLAQVFLTL